MKLFMTRTFESHSDFVIWQRKHLDGWYVVKEHVLNKNNCDDCSIKVLIVGLIRINENDRVA